MIVRPGETRRLAPTGEGRRGFQSVFASDREHLVYRTYAGQDQGRRSEQQDSVAAADSLREEERGVLCVLSDGMGGLSYGRESSSLVVETMISVFFDSSLDTPPERVLLRGCAEAQRAVVKAQESPRDRGATLVALLIRDGKCSFISVGDSRIMLYRGGGLIPLTRDMNKGRRLETQIGLGNLPPEARTDRGFRSLSAFIGMDTLDKVDRSAQPFTMAPGDRILLMSDGVYESLDRPEMLDALFLPEERVTGDLIDRVLAKEKPNQDNCTVLMVVCDTADPNGRKDV